MQLVGNKLVHNVRDCLLQGTTHLDIYSHTFGYHGNLLLTAVDIRWHDVFVSFYLFNNTLRKLDCVSLEWLDEWQRMN